MRNVISLKNIGVPIVFYACISLLACGFWDLSYIFYPTSILLAVVLLLRNYLTADTTINIRSLDIAIGVVIVAEVIVVAFSEYYPNSFLFLVNLAVAINCYFVLSLIGSHRFDHVISVLAGGYGALIGLATFFFFLFFRSTVLEESFTNLADLKHLYAPFGQLSNDWSAVLLIFLALNCYLFLLKPGKPHVKRWSSVIAVMFLLFGLIVSFSRGAYLALVLFIFSTSFLLGIFNVRPAGYIVRQAGMLFLVFACIGLLVRDPLVQTVKGTETTSQIRSISGRLSLWESTWDMISDHPVSGIGSGNFALYYPSYKDNALDTAYTTRVNNTFIQVAIEKGVIGILAYSFLLFVVFQALIKQMKSVDPEEKLLSCIVAGLLISFGVKEITFSSLFEHDGVFILLFLILMLLRPNSPTWYVMAYPKKIVTVPATFVFFVLLIGAGVKFYTVQRADRFHAMAISSIYEEEYKAGVDEISKARAFNPQHVLYHIHEAVALEQGNEMGMPGASISSMVNATDFVSRLSDTEKQHITDRYGRALDINPKDERAHHGLAWILFSDGMTTESLKHFQTAASLEPSEALYWISLALVTNHNGDTIMADQHFLKALLLSPDITKSILWQNLSSAYPVRAASIVKNVKEELKVRMEESPILKARYASLLTQPVQSDTAIALLESVTKEMPNLNRVWLNLAILYIQKRDLKKAVPCLKRSILLDKDDYLPILLLASYFEKIKRYDEAVLYYRRALEMQIHARSEYDTRTGKTYETPVGFRTFQPMKLWYAAKLQIPMGEVCARLAILSRKIGDGQMSKYYETLRDKDILTQTDLEQTFQ